MQWRIWWCATVLGGTAAAVISSPAGVSLPSAAGQQATIAAAAEKPAAQTPAGATAKEADASATYRITRETLRQEVDLEGVFESEKAAEVLIRPELWAELTVLEAVPHGARVEKGQTLVKLDTAKITDAIRDAEAAARLGELAAAQAIEDFKLLKETYPIDMAKAQRAAEIANEDLRRFVEIDLPVSQKSADFGLKAANQALEYQSEELRQLEKMYKADEVTEETEEIILKRTRNEVEQAKWSLERAKIHHDEVLKIELPRKQEETERAAKTGAIELERAKVSLPIMLRQKEVAAAKARQELEKAGENLGKLKHDLAAMQITAPQAGIVYYGRAVKGKWTGSVEAAAVLRAGGKLPANDVFMTVVSPEALLVRAVVAEKNLAMLKPGVAAKVTPTVKPEAKLPAIVASVSSIPVAIGGIDATVSFKLSGAAAGLLPGMTCKVEVAEASKPNVLTAPSGAVFDDPADPTKQYVLIVGKDGAKTRRPVKVGKRTDAKVELIEGVAEGDVIATKE
jgi:multidrug resistance efflux pump